VTKRTFWLSSALLLILGWAAVAFAEPTALPTVTVGVGKTTKPGEISTTLQIVFLMTVLSMAPGLLVMTTSFTRIVVVLSFLRNALGTQQAPSNQIIVGLSLFLTFFIMSPVWQQINSQALKPYQEQTISQDEAIKRAVAPVRKFMLSQTREKDLALFVEISKLPRPKNADDVPTLTLIPAFMISELRTAFQIGFLVYIPFLVVDMVVASVLMSMGMMMLPPVMISLPFKILLFVLVDGWGLVIGSLVKSFG
jgi:flagellar biosynthetic protein FliP